MPAAPTSPSATPPRRLDRRRAWQALALTVAAVALFVVVRRLPVGSDLNHMDFRVAGPNVIPFCDPANPAFIPVVAVRSPVELKLTADAAPAAGRPVALAIRLVTAGGKPIGDADLLESHTRKLHLLVVDPSLRDYQHVHPVPDESTGGWRCEFTPRFGGAYRVFADFMPRATGRGLYAYADLAVSGPPETAAPRNSPGAELDGYRLTFSLQPETLRVRQRAELKLGVAVPADGARVPLEPVMGAYAHVVAFDAARSGFAHLHPLAVDPLAAPDPVRPQLAFSIEIPEPGAYVFWAQLKLAGTERFVPFRVDVQP